MNSVMQSKYIVLHCRIAGNAGTIIQSQTPHAMRLRRQDPSRRCHAQERVVRERCVKTQHACTRGSDKIGAECGPASAFGLDEMRRISKRSRRPQSRRSKNRACEQWVARGQRLCSQNLSSLSASRVLGIDRGSHRTIALQPRLSSCAIVACADGVSAKLSNGLGTWLTGAHRPPADVRRT